MSNTHRSLRSLVESPIGGRGQRRGRRRGRRLGSFGVLATGAVGMGALGVAIAEIEVLLESDEALPPRG